MVFNGCRFLLWNFGGKWGFSVLRKLLKPSVPETLTLSKPFLHYDAGAPHRKLHCPGGGGFRLAPEEGIRINTRFDQEQLKSMRLREFRGRKRLTIDKGSRRFEVGVRASDLEREWLFNLLQKEYNL